MEVVVGLAAIAGVWWFAHRSVAASSSGTSGSGAGTSGTGQGTAPPPPAPPQLAPGVYAPNTPGAFPVQIGVMGGDGFGQITAQPGGKTGDTLTIWYGPGTPVLFSAQVLGGIAAFGVAFDHFVGTGGQTTAPSFGVSISGSGYVDAVFATFGIIGV